MTFPLKRCKKFCISMNFSVFFLYFFCIFSVFFLYFFCIFSVLFLYCFCICFCIVSVLFLYCFCIVSVFWPIFCLYFFCISLELHWETCGIINGTSRFPYCLIFWEVWSWFHFQDWRNSCFGRGDVHKTQNFGEIWVKFP